MDRNLLFLHLDSRMLQRLIIFMILSLLLFLTVVVPLPRWHAPTCFRYVLRNVVQLFIPLDLMISTLHFILQSTTRNIFVCTSEWDTQIGKQLRAMDDRNDKIDEQIFNSRTFSTEVGMRPAEPCSISVAATHQLLTNLFEYICVIILSNPSYRRTTAATITEQDLQVLEKCNRENISALCGIISVTTSGEPNAFGQTQTAKQLRAAGDLWADHILENAKAYIMTFVYIFATVVSGYPIVYGIALAAGLDSASDWAYFGESIMCS
jgi:hypothetical protein